MRDINYKFIGQLYGILSKVSFMIDSGRYVINLEEKASYNHIIEMWEESGSVLKSDLDTLVDMIYDCTDSKYWYDEDECYVINDIENNDEEEIEILDDEDCHCCDRCGENTPSITTLSDIDKERIKKMVREISAIVDEVANESR